jgi:cobalt/nickel transport system ATP-binding protein
LTLFALDRVTFRYGDVHALEEISLSIAKGARVALLGANGSGKSTLLRMLDALAFPSAGTMRFDGALIDADTMSDDRFAFAFRTRVGFVFQNPDVQLFNPTVFDELAFGPLQLGWPPDRIRARVGDALVRFGIEHLRERSPHRLSGGEKKRVCLASILILEPEVLLLDEPTAALDPHGQSVIFDLLYESAAAQRTIVIATHDLGIAEDLAETCVVMQAGRIAAQGPAKEIVRDEALLRRTGLLHAHRHAHDDGVVHTHPHRHREHGHD